MERLLLTRVQLKSPVLCVCAAMVLAVGLGFAPVHAAPLGAGNLLIYRVGDGSAALTSTATAVFLDEYSPSGSLVQTIPLSSSGASALTAVGNASTEGVINLSQDGTKLVFPGYRKDAGGTSPASDAPATTNRLIGTIGLTGVVDTSIAITDTTGTIRSATTVDGSTYYVGASSGLRYVATPGSSSTSTSIDTRNSRQVNLVSNVLYVSNGSTGTTNKIQSYGTLPTGATTPTPVVTLATSDAVHGFVMLDMNPGVSGADTIYCLSTVAGQLQKYNFDGTAWTQAGSITTAAANLTGIVDGTDVNLFLTTSSALLTVKDSSGAGGTLSGSLTTLAGAGSNTAFRGIGVIPEPATLSLLSCLTVLALRRRK